MTDTLSPLPHRFEGMPGMMQGGYIAALAAGDDRRAMRVRIRRPLHPGDVLERSSDGDAIELVRDGELVMRGTPTTMLVEPAAPLDLDVVRAAADRPLGFALPFPSCAGCGTRSDGLGASIRPVPGTGRMITLWTPSADEATPSGDTPRTHVWTVIDCITSWALFVDPPDHITHAVTGNIAMQFVAELRAGTTYVIQSWRDHNTERAAVVGGVIHDLDGNLIALADQELVGTDGWGMEIPPAPLA